MNEQEREFLNNQELFKSNLFKFQIQELLQENQKKKRKIAEFVSNVQAVIPDRKLQKIGSLALETLALDSLTIVDVIYEYDPAVAVETFDLLKELKAEIAAKGDWTYAIEAFQGNPTDPCLIVKQQKLGLRIITRPRTRFHDLLSSNPSAAVMRMHLNYIHERLQLNSELKSALILIKIWARRRGLYSTGLNGFVLSVLACRLVDLKIIKSKYSSFQMFKIFIDYLAKMDIKTSISCSSSSLTVEDILAEVKESCDCEDCNPAVSAKKQKGQDQTRLIDTLEKHRADILSNEKFVVVDPSSLLDMIKNVPIPALYYLKNEAQRTFNLINGNSDCFDMIFLQDCNKIFLKYDNVFKIPISDHLKVDIFNFKTVLDKVYDILSKGLGNRASLVNVFIPNLVAMVDFEKIAPQPLPKTKKRKIAKESNDYTNPWTLEKKEIVIGVLLDQQHCTRQVESCNSTDPAVVEAFKELWGSKSELRRFKDGSIVESVVFESDGTLHQKSLTVARITAFLLAKHLQVDEDDGMTYWAGLGNRYLKELDNEANSFQPLLDQFNNLGRKLRELDLPLSINRFHATSDSLLSASVIIPEPIPDLSFKSRSRPSEFFIEFEFSGKWPDNLKAIETMKRAFYIKIVNELQNSHPDINATVCLDKDNNCFLDIVDDQGYLFRARILHQRIEYLLEKAVKDIKNPIEKHELLEYQKEYLTRYNRIPTHYSLLSVLLNKYIYLGTTIRLAKRWLGCHLSLDTIGRKGNAGLLPMVVELLCVRVYTEPGQYNVPSSGWTGFVRFLNLLATFAWSDEPLIVQLEEGKLNEKLVQEIRDNFDELHKGGQGHITLFVGTELDTKSEWWNTLKIPKKVFERVVLLARTGIDYIKNQLDRAKDNDISKLFITTVSEFDFIIHLDVSYLLDHKKHYNVDKKNEAYPIMTSKYKNTLSKADKFLVKGSRVDLITEYVKDLQEKYQSLCLFFYDYYGGDKIAVKLIKDLKDLKFNINNSVNGYYKENGDFAFNLDCILAEMERLGHGFILGIEKH